MLQQVGHYNDFSPEFIEKIEKRIDSFGKIVRYRFDIEKPNPDKEFYNGKTIFPQMYTLDPTVFNITDKDEKRAGKSKMKTVALIKSSEMNEHGVLIPSFTKIRINAGARGILRLDLDKHEDREKCFLIELHPKLKGGLFADPDRFQVVSRVDENAEAQELRKERSAKLIALNAVADMDNEAVRLFADGMQWDSTVDIEILRNQIENLAETEPVFFNELTKGKSIEYQAIVKRAMDLDIISFDPAEYKFVWSGNRQPIAVLEPVGDKSEVEKMAQWLQIGAKGEEAYKKLKSLTSNKGKTVA